MPFTKTWTEEIVAEWLQLRGYVVEVGLPAAVTKRGGRFVADIVGAKIIGRTLEVVQVEVGQLSGGKSSMASLSKKFAPNICTCIERYFRKRMGFIKGNVKYQKMYVASFWTKPTLAGAKKLGIDIHPFPDFLRTHVLPAIDKWKANPPQQSKTKGYIITLPEAHWMLQLIDYLWNYELLK